MGLLFLCMGEWGGSYIAGIEIGYNSTGIIYAVDGEFCFVVTTAHWIAVPHFRIDRVGQSSLTWYEAMGGHHAFSFRCGHYVDFGTDVVWFGVPFWFLTTLSALALLFAWRKTVKPKLLRAFPVEVQRRA
ncbi:MAG: hypothetical protein WCI73_07635 [Phycisphaerae bacterium]